MVHKNSNFNNYYDIFTDYNIKKDEEKAEENFFKQKVKGKIEVSPKSTLDPKVVQGMKDFQAGKQNEQK